MNGETVKYIFEHPERLFSMLGSKGLLNWIPDELYIRIQFRLAMGVWPDLKDPKTFNEKLQWLKLHDRNPLYTTLVDKYAVRRYIAEKIGEEYLIPLVGGPWDRAEEIDFDALPEQFVLKCNHDSGGVVVCRDKSSLNIEKTKKFLNRRLKRNFFHTNREWPYKNVEPCIVAEKLIIDSKWPEVLRDYKFFCFNGIPRLMYIASDGSRDPRTDFFDMNFNHINIKMRDRSFDELPEKPELFGEMKRIATVLSEGLNHVRADFYVVDGRMYVGELTLYHCSGLVKINPPEWDEKIGAWLELPSKE